MLDNPNNASKFGKKLFSGSLFKDIMSTKDEK